MKTKVSTPRFIAAHCAIWAVVCSFGAFSAAGWWVRLADASVALAALMVAVSVTAACVSPVMIHVFERAGKVGKALAALVILTFGSVDAASGHNAFVTFEGQALAGERAAQQAVIDQRLAAAQADVAAAQARIDALPSSSAVCVGHGPLNCAARQQGLAADRAALVADRDAAQARLEAIDTTVTVAPIIAHHLVWTGMIAIQVALVIGVLALTMTTRRLQAQVKRAKASARAPRKAAAKPRIRRRRQRYASGVVTAEEKQMLLRGLGPRLVVDNG